MEQDRITTDEIEQQTAEGTLADTDDTAAQAQKGILYETSLKQAEKNAKKEKRKGVMQFIKYALCAASAGIIQIVLFSILQAVIPQSGKTIRFIVEDMDLVTFISTTVALCASILWNFTFNRKFTFKDAGNVPKAMVLAFLFYVPFYPFQTWYVHTIKSLLLGPLSTQASGIIAEGSVMVINCLCGKSLLCSAKKPPNSEQLRQNPTPKQSRTVSTLLSMCRVLSCSSSIWRLFFVP